MSIHRDPLVTNIHHDLQEDEPLSSLVVAQSGCWKWCVYRGRNWALQAYHLSRITGVNRFTGKLAPDMIGLWLQGIK